jgi:uncharacterized protein YjiS (DUF1127 family)
MSSSLTQPLPSRGFLPRLVMVVAGSFSASREQRRTMLHLPTLPAHRLRDLGLPRTDAGWRDPFPSQAVGDPRCLGRDLWPGTKA